MNNVHITKLTQGRLRIDKSAERLERDAARKLLLLYDAEGIVLSIEQAHSIEALRAAVAQLAALVEVLATLARTDSI